MVIKFYIASVIISITVTLITVFALKERLKREYPEAKAPKASIAEVIHSSLICFVPIFNIFPVIASVFFSDEVYEKVVKKIGVSK